MNTVEFAVRDGVPYAIDFTNSAPDFAITSLGEDTSPGREDDGGARDPRALDPPRGANYRWIPHRESVPHCNDVTDEPLTTNFPSQRRRRYHELLTPIWPLARGRARNGIARRTALFGDADLHRASAVLPLRR